MKILIIEDDRELAAAVAEALEEEHYAVDRAHTGAEADVMWDVHDYDLILLDWSIPPPTGIDLLRRRREAGDTTPVLMLTGRAALEDRVGGLDEGADDYLVKPFALEELLARVRSLLRRRERPLSTGLQAGDLSMDRPSRSVEVGGEEVRLSPKEFGILEYLLLHTDQVVSRTDLSEHVWDESFDAMSNTIDVLIHRLRKKIDHGRKGRLLHTVVGVGYILKSERS